jgi:hypothetical protein
MKRIVSKDQAILSDFGDHASCAELKAIVAAAETLYGAPVEVWARGNWYRNIKGADSLHVSAKVAGIGSKYLRLDVDGEVQTVEPVERWGMRCTAGLDSLTIKTKGD